jgi:hypothetical protein
LALLLAATAGCGRNSRAAPIDPPSTVALAASTWCGEGWRALDESTCLALPQRFADPPSLVIFAHGIVAPHTRPAAHQAALLAVSDKLGIAVMVPRGRQGLCDWDPGLADSYCWPVKRETVGPQRGHELDQEDLVAAWATWGR